MFLHVFAKMATFAGISLNNRKMKKLLLTFIALFVTLTTALGADPGFSADKLYRIDCACYAGQGAVVLGAKHSQSIYLYYLTGTDYPDDAWWRIEPVGDGSYTFRNAVSGQYMTADDALYDTATGKRLKLTDADEGDKSHWTFEETTYNEQTYYIVKCVSSEVDNPYFNMRMSNPEYMLGGYRNASYLNGWFAFYEKTDGGSVTPDPTPDPTPTDKITDYYTSVSINGKSLTYDSVNEAYYYTLPEALRQGGDYEASLTAAWNEGYETGYELRLNEQAPDATTGNITLSAPTCQTPYTLGVYDADGTLKASAPLNFTYLPIVEINTGSSEIGWSYTAGTIRVAEADAASKDTIVTAKYKIRGASSASRPKKSYAIKLYDADGNSLDYSFFGLRSDNNWILDAMYIDGACMRNRVGTDLWNDFAVKPYYAAKEKKALTGTRGRFVEVFMNGTYHGLYCMTEKMDRKQLKLKKYQAADPTVEGSTGKVRGLLYKTSNWGYAVHMGHDSNSKNYPGTSPSGYNNTLGNETWNCYELKYPDYAEEAVEFGPMYNAVNFVCTSSQADFESGVKSYFDFATTRDYYLFIDLLMATDNHGKNMFYYVYDHSKSDLVGMAPWDLDGTFGINWAGSNNYTYDATQDLDTFLWQHEHGQMGLYDKLAASTTLSWDNYLAARYAMLRRTQFQPEALAQRFATYASLFADSHADVREQNKWSSYHAVIQESATYAQEWVQKRVAALDLKYDYSTLVTQQPIVASTPDAPVWYGINLGTGAGSWAAAEGQIDAASVTLCATGLPESQQWCFVGDADEGYKIYNRARQQYLVSNGTDNSFGTEDQASIFLLSTSAASTEDKPCYSWRVAKNKYLAMNDGVTALTVGTTTDAQASWLFTPNNNYVLAYAQAYANIPEGALGMPTYLAEADHLAQYRAAYEAAVANATDANIAALVAMTQLVEQGGSPTVDVDNMKGNYYRLLNASTTGNHHMLAVQNGGAALNTVSHATTNADAVWQVADVMNNTLQLYHPNHAQYVQSTAAEVGGEAAYYTLASNGKAMFALEGGNGALTETADGTIVLTDGTDSDNAANWYLVPATTLDVKLNSAADGRSYATAYLPFGISRVEGAEAYVGEEPLNGRVYVSPTESFAAETGVLLVSTEGNDMATLTIGQGDDVYSAISGTLQQLTISDAERSSYLVFGRNAADLSQVGFFTPQRTTLSANRAFIRTTGDEALALDFDRVTTATGGIKQQPGSAKPIYHDLTGRRVFSPVKGGIYIVNGRKVVVQ